jgi:hypothetical protein
MLSGDVTLMSKQRWYLVPWRWGMSNSCRYFRTYNSCTTSLLQSARWRKTPASEQQKAFIAKRWSKQKSPPDPELGVVSVEQKIEKLTKGDAANIITRLKHGAQVITTICIFIIIEFTAI